jgi:hypothetical protein
MSLLPGAVIGDVPILPAADVMRFARSKRMESIGSDGTRTVLQELFARASARRAERRRFIQTLREIVERRLLAEPLLLLRIDRRRVPRDAPILVF